MDSHGATALLPLDPQHSCSCPKLSTYQGLKYGKVKEDLLRSPGGCEPTYQGLKQLYIFRPQKENRGCEPTYQRLKHDPCPAVVGILKPVASLPIQGLKLGCLAGRLTGGISCEPTYQGLKTWKEEEEEKSIGHSV